MNKITGIIESVNFSHFCDAWNRFDDRKNSFSYQGKRALYDYLEQLSEDMDEPIELDIVALDCEYTEYESAIEAWREYEGYQTPKEREEEPVEDIAEDEALEYLQYHTTVIEVENGGVIIAQF